MMNPIFGSTRHDSVPTCVQDCAVTCSANIAPKASAASNRQLRTMLLSSFRQFQIARLRDQRRKRRENDGCHDGSSRQAQSPPGNEGAGWGTFPVRSAWLVALTAEDCAAPAQKVKRRKDK